MGSAFEIGGGMGIFWSTLIGLVVWALYVVTGRLRPSPDDRQEAPLDALKKRLARGQIDAKEYPSSAGRTAEVSTTA